MTSAGIATTWLGTWRRYSKLDHNHHQQSAAPSLSCDTYSMEETSGVDVRITEPLRKRKGPQRIYNQRFVESSGRCKHATSSTLKCTPTAREIDLGVINFIPFE